MRRPHHHKHSRLHSLFSGHHHHRGDMIDSALETSSQGIRALKISLLGLLATALIQLLIYTKSGSVALLGDTLHNFGDALTAVPLWVAFSVGRRPPTERYTYGFGRAEDLAGLFILVVVAASAAIAGYEAVERIINPKEPRNLGLVVAASIIGFVGNELVALYRIRVGRAIGSAALVADGSHARVDGLTSLAVLAGAGGVAAGFPLADPLAGIIITAAILMILVTTARDVYHRLMDAVSPELVRSVREVLDAVEGVQAVTKVRIRWIGHQLHAEVYVTVDNALSVVEGHQIAVSAHHALLHNVPRLASAIVHSDPSHAEGVDYHAELAHHFR